MKSGCVYCGGCQGEFIAESDKEKNILSSIKVSLLWRVLRAVYFVSDKYGVACFSPLSVPL